MQYTQMKFLIIFLVIIVALLITSCGKGELVDKNSKYYRYSRDKNKIWYKKVNAPDVSGLWDYDWIEVPADAKSFKLLKYGIGKDKNHIFQTVNIITNVDYKTFTVDDAGFFRDKNHIYLNENASDGKLKILTNANPATYEIVKLGAVFYTEKPQYYWAKDDQRYFYKNKEIEVNYNTFRILTPNIVADKDSIISINHNTISRFENKNKTTDNFKVLDDHIIYSPNYFYFHDGDLITEIPIKDQNSIKMYCKRDYFAIDGIIYFRTIPIENADLATFETFDKGDAVWFAKDKNNVYVNSTIIVDANPKTVKYNSEKRTIEDGEYIWKWSEKELHTLIKVKKEN